MVADNELSEREIDRVFQALADSTRRDIVRRTLDQEQSVSTLASDYDMSFAAVQKHVAVLEAAGLIVKRAEGRERRVRADPAMIGRARMLLAQFEALWRSRITRLDDLLAETPSPAAAGASAPRASAPTTSKTDPAAQQASASSPELEGE